MGAPPNWNAVLRRLRTSRALRLTPPTRRARHTSESEEAAREVRRPREGPTQGRAGSSGFYPQIHTWETRQPQGKRWTPPAPATAHAWASSAPHVSSLPGQRAGCRHADVHSPAPGGSSAGCSVPFPHAVAGGRAAVSSSPDASGSGWVPVGANSYPIWEGGQASFPTPRTQVQPTAGRQGPEAQVSAVLPAAWPVRGTRGP